MDALQYVPLAICMGGLAYGFLRLAHFRPIEKRLDRNEKKTMELEKATSKIRIWLATHTEKLDGVVKNLDEAVKKLDRIAEGKK